DARVPLHRLRRAHADQAAKAEALRPVRQGRGSRLLAVELPRPPRRAPRVPPQALRREPRAHPLEARGKAKSEGEHMFVGDPVDWRRHNAARSASAYSVQLFITTRAPWRSVIRAAGQRANRRPVGIKSPAEAGQGLCYFPSKMNCRTSLIALSRFGAIASRPDDFSQACALSMFSNSVTPKRLGGSPSTAVIFSVGPAPPIHWPPAACIADASAGSYGGTEGRSMTSLSVTRYAFGLAWA